MMLQVQEAQHAEAGVQTGMLNQAKKLAMERVELQVQEAKRLKKERKESGVDVSVEKCLLRPYQESSALV